MRPRGRSRLHRNHHRRIAQRGLSLVLHRLAAGVIARSISDEAANPRRADRQDLCLLRHPRGNHQDLLLLENGMSSVQQGSSCLKLGKAFLVMSHDEVNSFDADQHPLYASLREAQASRGIPALRIYQGGEEGLLVFSDSRLVHASSEQYRGAAALKRILAFSSPHVRHEPLMRLPEINLRMQWEDLEVALARVLASRIAAGAQLVRGSASGLSRATWEGRAVFPAETVSPTKAVRQEAPAVAAPVRKVSPPTWEPTAASDSATSAEHPMRGAPASTPFAASVSSSGASLPTTGSENSTTSLSIPKVTATGRSRWVLASVALVAAMGVGAVVTRLAFSDSPEAQTGESDAIDGAAAQASAADTIYEEAQLTSAGDQQPVYEAGIYPESPTTSVALLPTIACRVLVERDGQVSQAQVFRSRLDLAEFESIALERVKSFRFRPAMHEGQPVRAWLNFPVTFREASSATIRIKGSNTLGGRLLPAIAELYQATHPNIQIEIEAHGSSTAFKALRESTAEVGASSRTASADELSAAQSSGTRLREFVLGYDGIVFLTHQKVGINSLSVSQLRSVFLGEATNWHDFGRADLEIVPWGRPASSGTHDFVLEHVLRRRDPKGSEEFAKSVSELEDSTQLVDKIASTPGAIGYVSIGAVQKDSRVNVLAVSDKAGQPAVEPDAQTIMNGTYPVYRPLLLYTANQLSREVVEFLAFLDTPAVRDELIAQGFVPAPQGSLSAVLQQVGVAQEHEAVPATVSVFRAHFLGGGSKLAPGEARSLDAAGLALRDRNLQVRLIARAPAAELGSAASSTAAGQSRSQRIRSEMVRSYLIAAGVEPTQIVIEDDVALDSDEPTAAADVARRGRRVDLLVGPRR